MEKLKQGEIMGLEDFRKKLDEVQRLHDKEVAEGKSDFNVFEALGVEYKENYHSAFLAYLLDSEESHYQKIFIEKFLEKLKVEKSIKQKLPKLKSEDVEFVETEYAIRENRRIDILMGFKNDFYILIENKIYAKDQDKQIRDYIEDLLKGNKCEERNKASGLLTIYLTPFEDNPSKRSFGLKSNTRWEIVGSEIIDKNPKSKIKPLYFKMDYQWIQEWLKECLEELKSISQEIIEKKPKGELGINKVIFTLEQYLNVLDWIIPDREIREDNPVLELICDEKYQQYAFEIYHGKEEDEQRKIVADVWEDFEEHIVRDFFAQLEDYCDENPVNLTKNERWFVFQTHKKNYNTTKQYRLRFFPKKYYDTNYWVGFNIFYNKPNYGCPSIDLRVHFADDCDSEDTNIDNDYKQIKSVVLKKLKSIVYGIGIKNYKRSKLTYWKENFLELGDGENLVSWILSTKKLSCNTIEEKNQAVIEEFIKKMQSFTMDKDIVATYRDMVRIANEEHEDYE